MLFWCGIRCKTLLENYGCGCVLAVPDFCNFEPQIWPEIITSRDAESTCFKGSRTSDSLRCRSQGMPGMLASMLCSQWLQLCKLKRPNSLGAALASEHWSPIFPCDIPIWLKREEGISPLTLALSGCIFRRHIAGVNIKPSPPSVRTLKGAVNTLKHNWDSSISTCCREGANNSQKMAVHGLLALRSV